jgi:hypothetical protein
MGVFENITRERLRQRYLYENYRGSYRVSVPNSSGPVEKRNHVCVVSLAAVINGKRLIYSTAQTYIYQLPHIAELQNPKFERSPTKTHIGGNGL